jgi:PST family polysaccharide transporter
VNYFARNLDDVLVGRFAGDTPAARAHNLGGYQKAYELLMLPLKQLSSPLSAVALPTLSRLQKQGERYRTTYLRALRLLVVLTMPLVAYLIVMAPELILVVLGDQWVHAARIFQVLGLAAITQPLGNSTGWLFISQDRTGDMLRWGFFGAGTAVIAFVAGLPWGAFGVAAAYAGSSVVVRTPALLWYVGRRGPVRTRDFYAATAPFLFSGLCTAAALLGARRLFPIGTPILALVAYAPVGIVVAVVALVPFASARATLRDAWAVLTSRLSGKSVKETAREKLAETASSEDVDD